MSNQNFDAHKGEHIPANPAADATMQETTTKPVQFPLVMLPGGFAVDAKFMEVIRLLALDHIPLLMPRCRVQGQGDCRRRILATSEEVENPLWPVVA